VVILALFGISPFLFPFRFILVQVAPLCEGILVAENECKAQEKTLYGITKGICPELQ
jgi:hypothetical protein